MDNIEKLPISYIPSSDSAYGEKDANYTIRRIYLTLLWLSLPTVLLFRVGVGSRYKSYINIVCSFLIVSFLSLQSLLTLATFYVPVINANLPINYIFYLTMALTILFARYLIMQTLILILCLVLINFSNFEIDLAWGVLTIVTLFYGATLLINKFIEMVLFKNKKWNTYYYGKGISVYLDKKEALKNKKKGRLEDDGVVFEVGAFFGVCFLLDFLFDLQNPFFEIMVIIIASRFLLALMHDYALYQYKQDLSDTDSSIKNSQSEEQAMTTYRVRSIR